MSIVIKGVNAPNNCYDCINSNDREPFELLSNCHTFGDLCEGKITANELPKDKRSDSCPVKQLPTPHGRLIDVDELVLRIQNSGNYLSPAILAFIETAETIIDKEE